MLQMKMFVFYFPNLQSLCHVCKILHRKSAHLSCACSFDIAEFLSPCSDYATSLEYQVGRVVLAR